MSRELLLTLAPLVVLMAASAAALRGLAWLSGAKMELRRLCKLHDDQRGGVQSLSFVLTLPLFVMFLMFIVQMSQLAIAHVVVEYSAFAAARSAVVWIPASLGPGAEQENQISHLHLVGEEVGEDGYTWSIYEVAPGGPKYTKVHLAAAMACLPISPSRDTGVRRDHPSNAALPSLVKAYHAAAPAEMDNPRVPDRLRNKLAFALANTHVQIRIRHKDVPPPPCGTPTLDEGPDPALMMDYDRPPYPDEYAFNEIGWQDQVEVTVYHHFALLPGPGRLLARRTDDATQSSRQAASPPPTADNGSQPGGSQFQFDDQGRPPPSGQEELNQNFGRVHDTYVYTIRSTVRMNNEGDKPILPYMQSLDGRPGSYRPPVPAGDPTGACDCLDDPQVQLSQ